MFKPHVTVACVVHAQDKFLIVEETINGKALWNQPAGHLEANETLLQAAERELWEETGIRATPQHFIRMHQLPEDVRVSEAAFWNEGQRQFLREEWVEDADWAIVVDEFNEALHADAVAARLASEMGSE